MMYYGGHMWGMPFLGGDWGWIMWIPIITFWILIFLLLYFIMRSLSSSNKSIDKNSIEILKERYAKGEITKEEYEKIKKDIS